MKILYSSTCPSQIVVSMKNFEKDVPPVQSVLLSFTYKDNPYKWTRTKFCSSDLVWIFFYPYKWMITVLQQSCGPILLQFSENLPHRLSKVSHSSNLRCAGKLWSWRTEWWVKCRNLTKCVQPHGFWNVEVEQKLSLKSAKKLTKKHFILSARRFQTWWDQFQKVKRRRLAHRWMRLTQDQSFPAHFESLVYDKPVRL